MGEPMLRDSSIVQTGELQKLLDWQLK